VSEWESEREWKSERTCDRERERERGKERQGGRPNLQSHTGKCLEIAKETIHLPGEKPALLQCLSCGSEKCWGPTASCCSHDFKILKSLTYPLRPSPHRRQGCGRDKHRQAKKKELDQAIPMGALSTTISIVGSPCQENGPVSKSILRV